MSRLCRYTVGEVSRAIISSHSNICNCKKSLFHLSWMECFFKSRALCAHVPESSLQMAGHLWSLSLSQFNRYPRPWQSSFVSSTRRPRKRHIALGSDVPLFTACCSHKLYLTDKTHDLTRLKTVTSKWINRYWGTFLELTNLRLVEDRSWVPVKNGLFLYLILLPLHLLSIKAAKF